MTDCTFLTAREWPRISPVHAPADPRRSQTRTLISLPAVAIVVTSYLFQSQFRTSVGLAWTARTGRSGGEVRISNTLRCPSAAHVARTVG